jgi:hypothetical protein
MNNTQREKIVARMSYIDGLPKDVRELVHEYGFTVVKAFLDQKITKASAIRHLIDTVRTGSIDPGTGAGGVGMVGGRAMCAVPIEPTPAMIAASMATVANHDMLVSKEEKHRLRLRAAIKAGMSRVV